MPPVSSWVGILALPSKSYCQFIKGLFILWGSEGREVQVTRRGSSVRCVPHKSAKGFSFLQGAWPQSSWQRWPETLTAHQQWSEGNRM